MQSTLLVYPVRPSARSSARRRGTCSPPLSAIVIGAGSTGLSAAEALVADGLRVTVIDRATLPLSGTSDRYRRLLRTPAVRILGNVEASELLGSADHHAVRGARTRVRGLHAAVFYCDLLVDATGTPAAFGRWRGYLGYLRPEDLDGRPAHRAAGL